MLFPIEQSEPEPRHDLQRLAEEIHREYFAEIRPLPIQWGRQIGRRRRRSIRLGSFDHLSKLIRIHPSLAHKSVPAYFIQSVIHHEYLHHLLGPAHNARFHRHERQFRYFRESKEWLKRHLPALLGSKRQRPTNRPVVARVIPTRRPQQLSLF